ncbi:hypothetical protein CDIK_1719 [Cucumispora dikerogammari]|nr:hypothetical protein CDIK_1719 [Cucumispora dikerogammari]
MDILVYPRFSIKLERFKQKSLFLTNNSTKKVVFFIKTTCPFAYNISPYLGTIDGKEEQIILITIKNMYKINKNSRLKLEFYDFPGIEKLSQEEIRDLLKEKKYTPGNVIYLSVEFPTEIQAGQMFSEYVGVNNKEEKEKQAENLNASSEYGISLVEKIGVVLVFVVVLVKMFFH